MASPVKLYQQEMHRNVGFFATWLPASILELGDFGVLEAGRFRKIGSLKEIGITDVEVREGTPENMSYSASAERKAGASTEASAAVPVAKAELSIRFTRQGGYVFEAAGMRNVEIANRMALANRILAVYEQDRWRKEWLVVDSIYRAASATIIVSEDGSSEIVLKASGNIPLGSLPLADPQLGLSVSSSSGKVVHVVAQSGLSPLYSCLKVRDPLIGLPWVGPSLAPVRGLDDKAAQALTRLGIEELLAS
jgi:hypothetical protein